MSARTFFEILVGLWLIVVFIINAGRSSLCSLSFLAENGETFYQSIKVFVLNSKSEWPLMVPLPYHLKHLITR